jgi:hypothetical protein
MATRKRKAVVAKDQPGNSTPAADKIAGLLAMIATKDMETDDAALKLDAIGFDAREISALLDVGPNYVNVARHRKKSAAKKPRKKG